MTIAMPTLPEHHLRLAMFQPDQPQNLGAIIRLCACFGLGLDVIEPCGFVWNDARIRRVAMDYGLRVAPARHRDWRSFRESCGARRIVLLTTKGTTSHTQYVWRTDDILLLGQESVGVPPYVADDVQKKIVLPLAAGARALNVAMAAAVAASEALRQAESSLTSLTPKKQVSPRPVDR